MDAWRRQLRHDPLPQLLRIEDEALRHFVRRDLLEERVGPAEDLWRLPGAQRILRRQLSAGAWPRPGKHKHAAINHRLIETWRQFRFLVEQYGFTRQHPAAAQAAEFLFTCQSERGDIRGMLANQYATYYTGAIMALLIQAGYAGDARIEKGFQWLLSMRQNDGGWTVPLQTNKLDRATQYRLTSQFAEPLEPDRSKPFSHNCTGMVLRAFAVHPAYRRTEAARTAARLLKSRLFQPDAYTSYRSAAYWLRFDFPFWWNNLVAALDSLSRIGIAAQDPDIRRAVDWLLDHQERDGLWRITYATPREQVSAAARRRGTRAWVSLAICRILKRLLR